MHKYQLFQAPIYKHQHHKHAKWTRISDTYISFSWQSLKFFFPPDLLREQASYLKTKASFEYKNFSSIKSKQNNKKLPMSSAKLRFKGQFKTHFCPQCSSHWCLVSKGCLELFSPVSGYVCVAFAFWKKTWLSQRNIYQNCSSNAQHFCAALCQTEASCADHWRTFPGWSLLWGSNCTPPTCARTKCRSERGAHCKPWSSVTQVTALPDFLAELERGHFPRGLARRKWWPKVSAWSSPQCDVNALKFYGASLAKVRQLCSHPLLCLVSRVYFYFFWWARRVTYNISFQFVVKVG